jgi:hypothetical protein
VSAPVVCPLQDIEPVWAIETEGPVETGVTIPSIEKQLPVVKVTYQVPAGCVAPVLRILNLITVPAATFCKAATVLTLMAGMITPLVVVEFGYVREVIAVYVVLLPKVYSSEPAPGPVPERLYTMLMVLIDTA